ncbi:MAG: peptidylprolyl isomerase [Candidatus Sumerlaeaceae bacterium]|nr:peptidylprolyl isomerase [Candidatus Sumerlaeaceae bacterium]
MNRLVASIAAFGVAACITAADAAARTVDRVVAKLNEDIIMQSDVDDFLDRRSRQTGERETLNEENLEALFDRTLLLQEAKKNLGKEPEQDLMQEVQETVAELRARYPSQEAFMKELARRDLTLDSLKERLLKNARTDFRVYRAVASRFMITDADVERFEAAERAAGRTPLALSLRRLCVPVEGSGAAAETQAREEVKQLLSRIQREGLRFPDGVKKYSKVPGAAVDGGSLGLMDLDKLAPAVQRAVADLKPGEVSQPVIAGSYACVFYVEGRREARALLFEKRFREERQRLLTELRRRAHLQVYDPTLKRCIPKSYRNADAAAGQSGAQPPPATAWEHWEREHGRVRNP